MAIYTTPQDISEKEKIIGGYLTGKQFVFLLIGLGLAAVFSFMFYPFFKNASIIIGVVVFIPLGGFFAVGKLKGLMPFDYIMYKREHNNKNKKLPNMRSDFLD